jgi:hypothetical protein
MENLDFQLNLSNYHHQVSFDYCILFFYFSLQTKSYKLSYLFV